MTTEVERELQKATGVKPKKGEDRQKYLVRLSDGCQEEDDDGDEVMSKDDWENLSEEAKDWVNAAVKSMDKKKTISDFEEPEEDEEEEPEEDEESEDEDEKPKKKGRPTKSTDEEDEDEDEKPRKKGKSKSDEDEDEEDSEDEDSEDEEDDDMPAKKKKSAKDDKPAKKGKGDRDRNENTATRSEARNEVFSYMLKHPKANAEEVAEAVDLTPSAVSLAVKYWRQITRFLDDKGKLQGVKLA